MSSAVTAIFNANSTQFQAELAKMEARTLKFSRTLAGAGGGHVAGLAGIIRESSVVAREIAAGRGSGRILGSLAILTQYLNSAAGAAAKGILPARVLADAYAVAAEKANFAAVAAMRKAEASSAAAEADGFESDAAIAAADAMALEAAAANATALALGRKAEVAALDAAAQESANVAAAAGVGIFGTLATVVAGVAATIFLAWERTEMLANRLAGLKAPDFTLEPIVRQNHSINEATEAQKKINDEIQTTIEKYNSAAAAAERLNQQTARQFEHQKKMLDLAKETELASATTSADKEAIEAKYAGKALDLQHQQDQQTLAGMFTEKANLTTEGNAAKQQADAIKVPSAAEDKQSEGVAKDKADYAQKFLTTRQEDPGMWEKTKDQFAAGFNPGARDAIKAAGKMNEDTAHAWIASYKKTVQATADNDELRRRQETLNKKSGESLGKAAQIGLQIPDKQRELKQSEQNASEESAAQLGAAKARDAAKNHSGNGHGTPLNNQQRIGAYAATTTEAKIHSMLLKSIVANTEHLKPSSSNKPPGTKPPQMGSSPGRSHF